MNTNIKSNIVTIIVAILGMILVFSLSTKANPFDKLINGKINQYNVTINDTLYVIVYNKYESLEEYPTFYITSDSTNVIEHACEGEIRNFIKTGIFNYDDFLCY